jgi:hypothetical protein
VQSRQIQLIKTLSEIFPQSLHDPNLLAIGGSAFQLSEKIAIPVFTILDMLNFSPSTKR